MREDDVDRSGRYGRIYKGWRHSTSPTLQHIGTHRGIRIAPTMPSVEMRCFNLLIFVAVLPLTDVSYNEGTGLSADATIPLILSTSPSVWHLTLAIKSSTKKPHLGLNSEVTLFDVLLERQHHARTSFSNEAMSCSFLGRDLSHATTVLPWIGMPFWVFGKKYSLGSLLIDIPVLGVFLLVTVPAMTTKAPELRLKVEKPLRSLLDLIQELKIAGQKVTERVAVLELMIPNLPPEAPVDFSHSELLVVSFGGTSVNHDVDSSVVGVCTPQPSAYGATESTVNLGKRKIYNT
ncbi:hypothetical protein BC830DRAFT_1215195 [Chytriomyces sp. MP71]|nr:hypothetical protein BC830DRAFT_1215195 [Chytriomyces sp. MP71]